ncbi:MAG: DUF1640 protein [Magnetococcales bacterium]|nr:DUF1640 protein [Magnetococcales bacterium]HIJ83232.1 DUF1640 domain-containing protein [Magnetococcales bacterium]
MNTTIAFDTHAYVKKLRDAGVDERQAEIQAEALVALVEDRLATKQDIFTLKRDLADVEANLRRDIKELDVKIEAVRADLKRDMEATKLEMRRDVESAKADTVKWTAGMFAAQTALIIGSMFAVMKMNQPSSFPPGYHTQPVQEMRLPAPAPTPTTPAQPPVSQVR